MRLPHLRNLILDGCPNFALFTTATSMPMPMPMPMRTRTRTSLSKKTAIKRTATNNDVCSTTSDDDINDDDDYRENDNDNDDLSEYSEFLNDTMMQDAEEITRIFRLSSLLADTVLLSSSPATTATATSTASATIGNRSYNNENDDKQPEQQHQLSILCSKLLRNCEKLEYLCIQDCNITTFSNDLLTCLPSDHFKELVLDIDINNDSDKNDSVNDSTEKKRKKVVVSNR